MDQDRLILRLAILAQLTHNRDPGEAIREALLSLIKELEQEGID